jgi:type 2 lantibiotic biosynthesis protein LanM
MTYAPPAIDLHQILARAVPPSERVNSTWVEPDPRQEPGVANGYLAAWKATVSRDPAGAAWLQEALNLPDATLREMFAAVRIRDGAVLPEWATVIVRALAAEPFPEPDPLDGVLGPFIALATFELDAIVAAAGLEVRDSARDDLLGMLRIRLGRVVAPALEHEQKLINSTALWLNPDGGGQLLDASVEGWLHRLSLLPALAHVVGTCYVHWRTFITEICTRTERDASLIASRFLGRETRGALEGVAGDTGDLHNDGRAVAILRFEGGGRVVYKPKDLAVAVGWMDLCQFLNDSGLALDLPVRTMLVQGDYTWEQFVETEPCTSHGQVSRFYRRMGETIRLLQFLEGRDFWLDNLIACGEYPHFIDIEMLLQPRRPLPSTLSAAEQATYDWLEESASRTSAIAMPMPIASGVPSQELGALGPVGPFASPFLFQLGALAASTGAPPLTEEGYVMWEHPEHVPVLYGVPIGSEDHLDDVLAGYTAMQECLVSVQGTLAAADGPLAHLASAPIRYIYRDTWSCLKLVHRSVQPGLLADAMHRELFLAQVLQPITADPDRQPEEARLVATEIDGFRKLDVPFFLTRADSDEVFAPSGLREPFFPSQAWDRLQARIAELDSFPLDEHLAIVRSSYASGRPLGAPGRQLAPGPDREPDSASCLATAEAVAQDVISLSFDDGRAWAGLAYHPPADVPNLEVLRPDVLTGTTGLSMLFADLYVATGEDRWRNAAIRAIEPSLRSWRDEIDRFQQGTHSLASAGAHYGLGAWLWALDRVGRAVGEPALAAELHRGREMVAARLGDTPFETGIATGHAGLLLASLAVFPEIVDREVAVAIAPALLSGLEAGQTRRAGKAEHGLRSLPGDAASAAIALVRMERRVQLDPAIGLRGALARWAAPYLATADTDGLPAGTLLALIEVGQFVDCGPQLRDLCDRWIASQLELNDPWRLLDVIDIALAMEGVTGTGGGAVRIAAGRLLDMHERHGSWFPGAWADDRHNLSAIWGQAAVAHALIRLGPSTGIDSLRLPG